MVQKPHDDACVSRPQFESSVVLDGTKTVERHEGSYIWFESSVVLDGTKTVRNINKQTTTFESSVVLDGTKTRT